MKFQEAPCVRTRIRGDKDENEGNCQAKGEFIMRLHGLMPMEFYHPVRFSSSYQTVLNEFNGGQEPPRASRDTHQHQNLPSSSTRLHEGE